MWADALFELKDKGKTFNYFYFCVATGRLFMQAETASTRCIS